LSNEQETDFSASGDSSKKRTTRTRLEQLKKSLELLKAVSQAISEASNETTLLNTVCEQIARLAGYRSVWIGYAENDAARTVQPVAKAGERKERIEAARITYSDTAAGRGPIGRAIRSKKVAISRDIRSDPFFADWQEEAIKDGYASSIAVPLVHDDKLLGTLNIYSTDPEAFSTEEVTVLAEIAQELTRAVYSLRERIASQTRLETLQRAQEVQVRFNSLLAEAALRRMPSDEFLQSVLELVLSLPWLNIQHKGSIFILDASSGVLEMRAHKGLNEAHQKACAQVPLGKCLCGRAALENKMQFAETVTPEHEITYPGMAPHGHYCVPIALGSEVLGVLNTYVDAGHKCTELEVDTLANLATLLALTIKHWRLQQELVEYESKMRRTLEDTVEALAAVIEARDPYTAGHQRRVAQLATALAKEMGLPTNVVEAVHIAGIIHDIGKMQVPAEILTKPGKLTDIEFNLIKQHSDAGYEILKNIDFPWPVAEIVRQHHERLNGSGYPRGLKGDEILLEARILAVADVIEAMSSHRPYRPALGTGVAIEEVTRNAGKLYDPEVANACVRLFYEKGFKLQ